MNTESLNTTSVTVITDGGKELNGVFLERFEDFSKEIVKHLKGEWKLIDFDRRRSSFECEETGYSFCIWALNGSHPKLVEKISIAHLQRGFPKDTYWVGLMKKLPDIGCSTKKGPVKIARDIENRFLPNYEREFIHEWKEAAKRSILETETILILNGLCKISKLCPQYKLKKGFNNFGAKEWNIGQSRYEVSFEIGGYKRHEVDLEFKNLDPTMAKKMLEAWNQLCEEEGLEPKREPELQYED